MSTTKKTKNKVLSFREAKKIVIKNGWKLVRTNGDHFYFKKKDDKRLLTLNCNLNRMVWQRLVKEYNINLEL